MSRELYDLCRKYKYFYNKHKDVESWSGKYHDLDLSMAINKTNAQLKEATHDLQKGLFKEFNVICESIDTEQEMPMIPMGRFGEYTNYLGRYNSTSDVVLHNSNEFLYCLSNYMQDWRKR